MIRYLFLILILILTRLLQVPAQTSGQNPDSTTFTKNIYFRQSIVPGSFMVAGTLLNSRKPGSLNIRIRDLRNQEFPDFHTSADNYLQYSPLVLMYGFDAIGMEPSSDLINQTLLMIKSQIVMSTCTSVIKHSFRNLRPDGSDYYSFPSGHTAQAFCAATMLSEEFGDRYKWVPYLSYGLASTVGIMRILNNRHYLGDVVFGAGLGILSTKIVYMTHRYRWGRRHNTVSYPY